MDWIARAIAKGKGASQYAFIIEAIVSTIQLVWYLFPTYLVFDFGLSFHLLYFFFLSKRRPKNILKMMLQNHHYTCFHSVVPSPKSIYLRVGISHSYSWQHSAYFYTGDVTYRIFNSFPQLHSSLWTGIESGTLLQMQHWLWPKLFALSTRSPYKYVILLWMELILYRF